MKIFNFSGLGLSYVSTLFLALASTCCLHAQLTVPGATYWLEADTLGDTAGPVSAWVDQTANPIVVSQAESSAQPTLVLNGPGGHSYVHFDGIDDVLLASSIRASELFTYSSSSTFIVLRPDATATTGHAVTPITWEQSSDPNFRFLVHSDWSSNIYYQQGHALIGGSTASAPQPPGYHGDWHILSLTRSGDTASIRLDGVPLTVTGPLSAGNGITTSELGELFIGRHRDDPLTSDIAEMIVYPTGLSTTSVESVESYLQAKYFTPVPEPVAVGSVVGLGCLVGAVFTRRRRPQPISRF